jgi:hypothetical protein
MTETESARNFLSPKERKTLAKIKQSPWKIYPNKQLPIFRFIKILVMNAHTLNDLTQLDPKDVVSAGGKLIIGSPYNN